MAVEVMFSSFCCAQVVLVIKMADQLEVGRGANVEYDTAKQFSATLFRFAGEKVHFIMAPFRVKFVNAPDFDLAFPPGHHEATFGDGGDDGGLRDCRKSEVVFNAELAERDGNRSHVDT